MFRLCDIGELEKQYLVPEPTILIKDVNIFTFIFAIFLVCQGLF